MALVKFLVISVTGVVGPDNVFYSNGQSFLAEQFDPVVVAALTNGSIVPFGGVPLPPPGPAPLQIPQPSIFLEFLKINGSTPLTADWFVNGFRIAGLGTPIASQDAATKFYVDSQGGNFINVNGTVPLTADWNVGGHKLTNVNDPTNPQDVATKNYIDTDFVKRDGSTTLTSDWNIGSRKITSLTDPSNPQDAATKNYVDTDFVKRDGSSTLTANWNVGSHQITSVQNPTNPQDVATKSYVDTSVGSATFVNVNGTTPLTADWNVGNHKLTSLTDPTNPQDAATKNYVDVQGQAYLNENGSVALTSDWNVGAHKITGLADPTSPTDAVTKEYADSIASGVATKPASRLATTGPLPSYVYAHGGGIPDVGATITATAFGTLSLDGFTVVNGDAVLIKDETGGNAPFNGIYIVTQAGDISHPFILTRATYNDSAQSHPPDFLPDVQYGDFTFIEQGTANGNNGFVLIGTASITVGTTPLTWTQFSGTGQINAGNGLTKIGNTLNVTPGDGSLSATPGSLVVNYAPALSTTGSPVVVSGSAPPSVGFALVATSPTNAIWQSLPASGTSLDGAYDFGGSGFGRTITVDSGAVQFLSSSGDNNNVLEIQKLRRLPNLVLLSFLR